MKRNWDNIRKVRCSVTKAALAACQDDSTLQKLRIAFPQCFEEGEDEAVRWSEIVEEWNLFAIEHYDVKGEKRLESPVYPELFYFQWDDGYQHPARLCMRGALEEPDAFKVFSKQSVVDLTIPVDVARQLDEQFSCYELEKPMEVTYLDTPWIVSYMYNDKGPNGEYREDPATQNNGLLVLVPKHLIIFDL